MGFKMIVEVNGSGERRAGAERRRFSYDRYLPERRRHQDRRGLKKSGRTNDRLADGRENGIERREAPRLQVRESAYVAVRPHYHTVGPIIDINTKGLAFTYMATISNDNDSTELDIFLLHGNFYLKRIPFKTIADFGMPPHSPFGSLVTRRRCVRFGRLSPSQHSRLKSFINDYTIHEEAH